MLNPIAGEIFYIDKPLQWTSFAVVKKIRSCLRSHLGTSNVRVGHAGTLDPLASGVLIVCTGRKTKMIEQLQGGVKEYIAHVRVGQTTPSYDMETEVDATYPWQHITREQVERVLREQFTGTIEQVPPRYSACKVEGTPAYVLARKGENVDIKAKTLVIDEIELLECGLPAEPTLTLRVVCSKGTYIRALARDIGQALGSGAHLTALRRTRVGNVRVDSCQQLDDLIAWLDKQNYVMPDQAEEQRLEQERIDNRKRMAAIKAARRAREQAKQARVSQLKSPSGEL